MGLASISSQKSREEEYIEHIKTILRTQVEIMNKNIDDTRENGKELELNELFKGTVFEISKCE